LKYRFDGKEKRISFGVYPETGIKEVQKINANPRDTRQQIAAGIDPGQQRKAERQTLVNERKTRLRRSPANGSRWCHRRGSKAIAAGSFGASWISLARVELRTALRRTYRGRDGGSFLMREAG
jgi:hypothetical protein